MLSNILPINGHNFLQAAILKSDLMRAVQPPENAEIPNGGKFPEPGNFLAIEIQNSTKLFAFL
jgi:hypothetical protein